MATMRICHFMDDMHKQNVGSMYKHFANEKETKRKHSNYNVQLEICAT